MAKNELFNLSRYVTSYVTEQEGKDVPYGLQLSGYRENDDGKAEYVNLWLKFDPREVRLEKLRDGNWKLSVKIYGVTEKKKDKKKKKDKPSDDDDL